MPAQERPLLRTPPGSPQTKTARDLKRNEKGKQLTGRIEGDGDILTREQVLQILSEQARKGSVTAAVALERALRLEAPDEEAEDDLFAELDQLSRRDD